MRNLYLTAPLALVLLAGCASYEQGGILGNGGVVDTAVDLVAGSNGGMAEAVILLNSVSEIDIDWRSFEGNLLAARLIDTVREREAGLITDAIARERAVEALREYQGRV